jgi:Flp pilus assembly protein TadG
MRKLLLPIRDDRGAAVIEMAIILPVLVLFLWGIFQVGVAFQASAGMQHALGEGARLATICQNPTAAGVCSTATDAEIEARVNEKLFGTGIGDFDVTVTRPADDPATADVDESDVDYLNLNTTFTMPTNFLFFDGPDINLAQTKRVYVAS